MYLKIFTDGGSRGNPGPGGVGVYVVDQDDKIIFQHGKFLGTVTNNQAEYQAFQISLDWLLEYSKKHQVQKINWFLDSKLVVEQLNHRWKIKNEEIKKIAGQIFAKLNQLGFLYSIKHIPREENSKADELVNRAVDLGIRE